MKIKLTGDGDLKLLLSKVQSNMLTRTVMGKMAASAKTIIFKRTVQKGKDKTGKPFKKYSRGYLEYKKERGGKFFTGKVNLYDGKDMMGDLQFDVVSNKRAFLHFPKALENIKAAGHISGSKRLPKRDFFGLTSPEEKELLLIPERHLERLARGHN